MSAAAAERWARARSFHHSRYSAQLIAAEREASIAVCLPARECARTIAPLVEELLALRQRGALDEVLVVDAASGDGTAEVALAAGATVRQEQELMPALGPVLGKGDAMWRALSAIDADIVCYLDADSSGPCAHYATGLLGPLVCESGVSFTKAFYRRPFVQDGLTIPEGGGRVNELLARPALALFYPELSGVRQPLGGEVAARRELLASIPFATGYGVEIAMLIDVWRAVGLDAIAQVDLDERRNRHQPLPALARMAKTVLAAVAVRAERDGRLVRDAAEVPDQPVERPPLASVAVA